MFQYCAASATGLVATEHPGPRKTTVFVDDVFSKSSMARMATPLSHCNFMINYNSFYVRSVCRKLMVSSQFVVVVVAAAAAAAFFTHFHSQEKNYKKIAVI